MTYLHSDIKNDSKNREIMSLKSIILFTHVFGIGSYSCKININGYMVFSHYILYSFTNNIVSVLNLNDKNIKYSLKNVYYSTIIFRSVLTHFT